MAVKRRKKMTVAGQRNGAEPPSPAASIWDDPEKAVYSVAELAWKEGLAANSIAALLGGPAYIMKVKRALTQALKAGPGRTPVLVLNQPPAMEAEKALRRLKYKARKYRVVDDFVPVGFTAQVAVDRICMAAAEEVRDAILRLVEVRKTGDIVIANAGGRAVSSMTRFLDRIAPLLAIEDRKRLVFLALNSAGRRRAYDESSNFLSVRMAEIFGSRHLAVLEHPEPEADAEYRERVKQIDLLICGAGGGQSLLTEHAKESDVKLPKGYTGDLCFVPLDGEGREIADPRLRELLRGVRPEPGYQEMLLMLPDANKEILVIFSSEEPSHKVPITHAILSRGLATHCVMGAALARLLVSHAGSR